MTLWTRTFLLAVASVLLYDRAKCAICLLWLKYDRDRAKNAQLGGLDPSATMAAASVFALLNTLHLFTEVIAHQWHDSSIQRYYHTTP